MAQYEITLPTGEVYQVNADSEEQLTAGVQELEATAYGGGGIVSPQGENPQFNQAFDTSQDRPGMAPAVAAAGDEAVHGAADERGFWANLGNAALMDTGDEILGTFGGLITMAQGKDFSEGYNKLAGATRRDIHNYEQRYPVASTVGKLAGGAATAFLPGGAAVRGASLLGKVGRGALAGATYGGAQGFAAGEGGIGNRLESGAIGAGVGAGIGGAIAPVGQIAGNIVGRRQGAAATPTTERFTAEAQRIYDVADNAGAVITPRATRRLDQVQQNLGAEIADPSIPPEEIRSLYPKSLASLAVIRSMFDKPITFRNVEVRRRMLLDAMMDAEAGSADERVASVALNKFDDWVNTIPLGDFHGGTLPGPEVRKLYIEARKMWKTRMKAQTLERIVEQADNQVIQDPGFRNQARAARYEAGFRRLLNNRELMKGYQGAERQAIESAAGGTRGKRFLRGVDLATPGFSLGRVPQATGWGLAGALASPAIPAAAAVAGTTARVARNRSVVNAGRNASLPTRAGGVNPFDATAARTRELYADRLASAATQPGGGQLSQGLVGDQVLDLGSISERGVPGRYVPR